MPYDTVTGEWVEPDDQQDQGNVRDADGQPRTNSEWAQFRREQKARREAEEKAKQAERDLAFYRAGIDPSADPKLSFFVKGYEGEATPEAIRKAAEEAGFIQPPAQDQVDPQVQAQQQAELGAQQRVAAAGTGATPPQVDPSTLVQDAFIKGGTEGLLAHLSAQGIPIASEGVLIEPDR